MGLHYYYFWSWRWWGLEGFWESFWGGMAGTKEVMLFGRPDTLFVPFKMFSILGSELEDTNPLGGVDELVAWLTCIPVGCGWSAASVSFICCCTWGESSILISSNSLPSRPWLMHHCWFRQVLLCRGMPLAHKQSWAHSTSFLLPVLFIKVGMAFDQTLLSVFPYIEDQLLLPTSIYQSYVWI